MDKDKRRIAGMKRKGDGTYLKTLLVGAEVKQKYGG